MQADATHAHLANQYAVPQLLPPRLNEPENPQILPTLLFLTIDSNLVKTRNAKKPVSFLFLPFFTKAKLHKPNRIF